MILKTTKEIKEGETIHKVSTQKFKVVLDDPNLNYYIVLDEKGIQRQLPKAGEYFIESLPVEKKEVIKRKKRAE